MKVCVLCAAVRAVRWHVAAGVSRAVVHICLPALAGGLGLLISLVLHLTISCEAERTGWWEQAPG